MKNCVTHHHACDCREAMFEEIKKELETVKAERDEVEKKCVELVNKYSAFSVKYAVRTDEATEARKERDEYKQWCERLADALRFMLLNYGSKNTEGVSEIFTAFNDFKKGKDQSNEGDQNE